MPGNTFALLGLVHGLVLSHLHGSFQVKLHLY